MSTYRMVGGDRREYGPASEEQVCQWITEGRANSETLLQVEGGLWKRLATYPEFADALQAASPPAGLPPPPITPSTPPVAVGATRPPGDPRRLVTAPAIFLIVASVLDLAWSAFSLLAAILGSGAGFMHRGRLPFQGSGDPGMDRILEILLGPVGMGLEVVGLLVSGLIIAGALRMMALRNYSLCLVVAILAIIPCTAPCCCLGIPAGIWALVVLLRSDVKAAFS